MNSQRLPSSPGTMGRLRSRWTANWCIRCTAMTASPNTASLSTLCDGIKPRQPLNLPKRLQRHARTVNSPRLAKAVEGVCVATSSQNWSTKSDDGAGNPDLTFTAKSRHYWRQPSWWWATTYACLVCVGWHIVFVQHIEEDGQVC